MEVDAVAVAAGSYRRGREEPYKLVEDGTTEIFFVLKDRLNALKAERDNAKSALVHRGSRDVLERTVLAQRHPDSEVHR
jgi:hypothetical protein